MPSSAKDTAAPTLRVYLVLGMGLLCFALSPILVRMANEAPGIAVATWRSILSVLLLAPFALCSIGNELKRFTRREWLLVLSAGILLGLHFVTFIESLYHTTVASATVLVWTNPIFIAVLGYLFLKEAVSRPLAVGIGIAVLGMALVGWGDATSTVQTAPRPVLGNLLALSAAVVLSIYLLIGRVVRQRYSWLAYVFPLYFIVALTTLLMAFAFDIPLLGYDLKVYGLILLMALGPSLIGHGSFNYAVRYLPAALLGVLALLEPVGASIAAYFLFDEIPAALAVVGLVVVLVGIGYGVLPRRIPSSK